MQKIYAVFTMVDNRVEIVVGYKKEVDAIQFIHRKLMDEKDSRPFWTQLIYIKQ
jgi:hypothetical protein